MASGFVFGQPDGYSRCHCVLFCRSDVSGRTRTSTPREVIRYDQLVFQSLVAALTVVMQNEPANGVRNEPLSEKIVRSRQDSLLLRTNLPAMPFRLGRVWRR